MPVLRLIPTSLTGSFSGHGENDVDVFRDTFLYYKWEKEYDEHVSSLADSVFSVNITGVILAQENYPDSFNGDTSFDEFHSYVADHSQLTVYVHIPDTGDDVRTRRDDLVVQLSQFSKVGELIVRTYSPEEYTAWKEEADAGTGEQTPAPFPSAPPIKEELQQSWGK